MAEEPQRRPDEPRSFEEIEVMSPGERRRREREEGRLDAGSRRGSSPDNAGAKP